MTTLLDESLIARERGELYRPAGFAWVGLFLRLGVPHRIVPHGHFEAEGGAAYLTCQCGVAHCIEIGRYPQACACPRWFFFDGTDVWALCSPVSG